MRFALIAEMRLSISDRLSEMSDMDRSSRTGLRDIILTLRAYPFRSHIGTDCDTCRASSDAAAAEKRPAAAPNGRRIPWLIAGATERPRNWRARRPPALA